ncbi:testis-expressed protein 10 homolog [Mercenaria mercenaria]|uniref:testis-expressed protein 10 homolog n=1 Tax=Mercenaria mercenaria TaxID=6596 RepID=UPI00234F8699|nr:testis-expressed protein 10 homolog [Mercenaria mercenaria]XP_053373640.1 testis-expressed protein 10 homolog [Mercenaria mercenaria]
MAKSKKKRQQDFQKVKLKVGKKLKKADNVTNASFRTRGIQISQQLKTGDASQPSTKKKQNITDLFSQCRHYSTSVRVEAVNGLKELITTNPELVHSHLSDILERVAELLTDKDSIVRQGAIRVFKFMLPLVSEKHISPFFSLLCAHLCCAMTHIYDDIQVGSLAVLDLLLENYPRLMIYKSSQVLSNFIEQISRQQGQGQSKRSLSTNPNSATSSVKWRSSVLNRLQKFLSAILKFQGASTEGTCVSDDLEMSATSNDVTFTPDEVMSVQTFPAYIRNQWVMPGFVVSSSISKDADGKADILNGKFPEFAATLMPLMLECWVESAPSKDTNKTSGGNLLSGDNVGMMYNILQVTQLLWECINALSTEESGGTLGHGQYLKEFEQHFMASFPYSVNTRASTKGKGKKQQADNVQVSAEILNLTICNIMTHFIGERSTSQRQSHDPAWLPMVTKYLNDFLRGKYGTAGVGQSARTVVNILERLVARGHVRGPVLGIVTEVYNRFQAANISSTEKKVYMQFFADTMLADHTQFISPQLKTKFLHSLPELLPLCTKENSEITSLVINTIKKAACQRCSGLLDRELFNRVGQQWYDPQQDVITRLTSEDQRSLICLLYYVPDIGIELTKILVSLARCPDISANLVSFMIQVLQNRFLRSDMRPEEATVHIGFLTNLLLGVSRSEIDSIAEVDNSAQCPTMGGYNIVKNSVIDSENIADFERQSFIVEVVCTSVQQFYNTDQVVEVMFGFIEKTLENASGVPLQLAFGICKFAESLACMPSTVVFLISTLCVSLVSHLVTWQHSNNQNAIKVMLELGCNLLLKTPGGVENLFTEAKDRFSKDISMDMVILIMKTVMLFLTEGRQQCMRSRPECVQTLLDIHTSLQTYLTQHKTLVPTEAEKLFSNFSYLVSCVK